MKIALIWAMAENRTIGRDKTLPWRLPNELKYFSETTRGFPVVMGRRTFESMHSKPLADRHNVVVSSQDLATKDHDFVVARSLDEAFTLAKQSTEPSPEKCFVIGGRHIYVEAMRHADLLYMTEVHAQIEGDVFFPKFDLTQFEKVSTASYDADEEHAYAYSTSVLRRIRKPTRGAS